MGRSCNGEDLLLVTAIACHSEVSGPEIHPRGIDIHELHASWGDDIGCGRRKVAGGCYIPEVSGDRKRSASGVVDREAHVVIAVTIDDIDDLP